MNSFCILIPVKNGMPLIKDTVNSIIQQRLLFSSPITVVVCDALSSDGTKEYLDSVAQEMKNNEINLHVISREDTSMYDALAFGMKQLDKMHDIYCYINAGDYFSPYAFSTVSRFINEGYCWLTGMDAIYSHDGMLTSLNLPVLYPQTLIKQGFFGTKLPYIQQESTFWCRKLQEKLDLHALANFNYAGDFFIWKTFADYENLFIIQAWLGGFRIHDGQQSNRFAKEYREEFLTITSKKNMLSYPLSFIIWVLLKFPPRLKLLLSRKILIVD